MGIPLYPPRPAPRWQLSQAARDVLAERHRQVEVEEWTAEHDDQHNEGEMALAAACYAMAECGAPGFYATQPPWMWPWSKNWWKPRSCRRNLVKAAALILAEIERLDRAEARLTTKGATP